jgi:hypothetical protein
MTKLKSFLFATMLMVGAIVNAQTDNKIEMREDGTFRIPPTELKEVYTLDITSLNFESFDSAVNYLSQKNTDLILFRPNGDGTEATVFLQLSKKPQWTVSDWNGAISEITFP